MLPTIITHALAAMLAAAVTMALWFRDVQRHGAHSAGVERGSAMLERLLTEARSRTQSEHTRAQEWRAAALDAQRSLAELQRRYAPPEPLPEGDIAQPLSVVEADAQAAQAQQKVGVVSVPWRADLKVTP